MKQLREALSEYMPAMLRVIARGWALSLPDDHDKAALVEILAAAMLTPDALRARLDALSPQERQALALVAASGKLPGHRLTRAFGPLRRLTAKRLASLDLADASLSAVERLLYLGLIYRGYDVLGEYRGEIYYVPGDLLALLPPLPAVATPAFAVAPRPAPQAQRGDQTALARDMATLLGYLRREEVRVRVVPYLTRQDIWRLASRLELASGADEALYLRFLQHLVLRMGLVRREGHLLRPGLKAKEWLQSAPAARARRLFEVWRDDRAWNELRQLPTLEWQDPPRRSDPRQPRQRVLSHLRQLAPNAWYGIADLVAAIKEADADFLRPDGYYDAWYVRDAASKRLLSGFASWDAVEGALIAHLIQGPLYWLGMVWLGQEADEGEAFALTPLGAALLELPGVKMPALPERPVVVQADFTVLATRETNLYDRYQLERLAERESHDTATLYRLTADSIRRSLREGIEASAIIAFLRRASAGRLPQNVERTLHEWGEKHGELRLAHVLLLTARDEQTMREIRALPPLRPYLGEAISPVATLVDSAHKQVVIELLERLGYWPEIVEST